MPRKRRMASRDRRDNKDFEISGSNQKGSVRRDNVSSEPFNKNSVHREEYDEIIEDSKFGFVGDIASSSTKVTIYRPLPRYPQRGRYDIWVREYEEELIYMFEVVCYSLSKVLKNKDITYTDFCRFVYSTSSGHITPHYY